MEQPKIQLEAGKYYQTQTGRRGYVWGKNHLRFMTSRETPDAAFIGVLEVGWSVCGWDENGKCLNFAGTCDLVAEWVEPKRIKGWVNVYSDVHGNVPGGVIVNNCLHQTREDADTYALDGLIACIELDFLEGQGLEGGR